MLSKAKTWIRQHRRRTVFLCVAALLVIGYLAWRLIDQREVRLIALDAKTGQVQWSALLPDNAWEVSEPVVDNGRVVVSLNLPPADDQRPIWGLFTFDGASGQKLWDFTLDHYAIGQLNDYYHILAYVPYVVADTVYARLPDDHNTLVAVDATNGKLKWKQPSALDWHSDHYVAARLVGDHLITLSLGTPFTLRWLDPQTGAGLSDVKQPAIGETNTEPYLVANDQSIFLLTDQGIKAFDARSGTQQFKTDRVYSRLWVVGSALYTAGEGEIRSFDATTGTERWVYVPADPSRKSWLFTTVRADSESVYVFCKGFQVDLTMPAWLVALDARDGHERWTKPVTSSQYIATFGAVSSTADTVFVPGGTEFGTGYAAGDTPVMAVMALSATDGAERWRFGVRVLSPFPFNTPTTDGSHVFVVDHSPRWRNWLSQINPAWH